MILAKLLAESHDSSEVPQNLNVETSLIRIKWFKRLQETRNPIKKNGNLHFVPNQTREQCRGVELEPCCQSSLP